MADNNLPQRPELGEWLENALGLPFQLPRIPFVQTAKNFDKAVASLVAAGGENLAARIRASTSRIDARSGAERALIEYGTKQIENSDPAFAERARDHAIGDILTSQANREEVLRYASEELTEDKPNTEAGSALDDDWLNAFSKYAEQKSQTDVQRVWGRILAAEIRSPGATSLRTLQFLSTVSAAEGAKIAKAFVYVIDGAFLPKSVEGGDRISYADLMELQELNVITGLYGVGGHTLQMTGNPATGWGLLFNFRYFERNGVFQSDGPEFKVEIPVLALTAIGRQLFAISDKLVPDYAFFKDFCLSIKPPNTKRIQVLGPGAATEVIFQATA